MRIIATLARLIFLVSTSVPTSLFAQQALPQFVPDCGGIHDLCGYKDAAGALVIPHRFESNHPFSEGMAAVSINGRYGYIDERGKLVIEPRFVLAGNFRRGLAEVVIADKAGVIDTAGRIVLSPQFARAIPLTKDVVLASAGSWKWRFYHPSDESLPNYVDEPDFHRSSYQNRWGLYHASSGWLTKSNLAFVHFDNPDRGLIWARDPISSLFGLLRVDGNWQEQPVFSKVNPLQGGRAVVQVQEAGDPKKSQYGAVDHDGKLVVSLRSNSLHFLPHGIGFEFVPNKGHRLIDNHGKYIGEQYVSGFSYKPNDSGAILAFQGGRTVGLDRNGNVVESPDHGEAIASCPSGVRLVRDRPLGHAAKIKVVGPDGSQTVPHLLEHDWLVLKCDRPTAVKIGSKWSYLGTDGRLLFDPPIFEPFSNFPSAPFEGGYAIVRLNGKFGVIDTGGQFTIEPIYGDLQQDFRDPRFFDASKDGQRVRMTGDGKPAGPRPPETNNWPAQLLCKNGNKLIERDGNWGIVSPVGRELIEPRYRAIFCFQKGVAWAANDTTKQWCPVDAEGALREGAQCRSVASIDQWPLWAPTFHQPPAPRLADDPYENSVLNIRAPLDNALNVYNNRLFQSGGR